MNANLLRNRMSVIDLCLHAGRKMPIGTTVERFPIPKQHYRVGAHGERYGDPITDLPCFVIEDGRCGPGSHQVARRKRRRPVAVVEDGRPVSAPRKSNRSVRSGSVEAGRVGREA